MNQKISAIEFLGFGWSTSYQVKRGTTRISINKRIADGLPISKGKRVYGYLVKELASNRFGLLYMVDGKRRDGEDGELEEVEQATGKKPGLFMIDERH